MALDSGPEMAFSILVGRTLRACVEEDPGKHFYRTTQEVYSFAADFNDLCAEADGELSAMGLRVAPFTGQSISKREYRLGNHVSANGWATVHIYEDIDLRVYSSSGSSEFEFDWCPRKGWVSVLVFRRRLRSWPPKNFLIRLPR